MIIPTDQIFRRVETHNETIKQRPGCQVILAPTTLPMCHRCLEPGALGGWCYDVRGLVLE